MREPRIRRGEIPVALVRNGQRWTEQLLEEVQKWKDGGRQGRMPRGDCDRYGHEEVRVALVTMHHSLCCYCESRVGETSANHVEHYRPMGLEEFVPLSYDWENLLLACQLCNIYKSDHFDTNCRPVNPTLEDPLDHIAFDAGIPYGVTDQGEWTVRWCKLDRLNTARTSYLNHIMRDMRIVQQIIRRGLPLNPEDRVIAEEIMTEVQASIQVNAIWSTAVRSNLEKEILRLQTEWDAFLQTA